MMNREEELAFKLLSSLHLNVEERAALLHGHVKFSAAVSAVAGPYLKSLIENKLPHLRAVQFHMKFTSNQLFSGYD